MNSSTGSYQRALAQLNPNQRQAVEQIDGPVLVLAGPGSGKTQLLATRIGYILAHSDASAQNILCLTFSEAAAATMRQRLARLIGPAAYEVTIATYHGFGSELINRYPELGGEQLTAADELAQDQLVRKIQSQLEYDNPFKAEHFAPDIRSLISSYKRALITPETLKAICAQNLSTIDQISELLNDQLTVGERVSKKQYPAYQALYDQINQLPEQQSIDRLPLLRDSFSNDLAIALSEVEATGKMTAVSKLKTRWLEVDDKGQYELSSRKTQRRQLAFADIFERYQQELSSSARYDYDDMINRAVKGLENNVDIKLTLQERYQYLLLDEFQDTNQSQLRLIELLSDNPVLEGRPNVLAVGDDDQAIYSFQGANYSHLQRFAAIYRQVKIISLEDNYRSGKTVIDFCSGLRDLISDKLTIASKQQRPAQKTLGKIHRVQLTLDSEHLAWVATRVKQLLNQGVSPSEIALIAPKHKLLQSIIPYLHAQEIAVNYELRENILDDPLINELLTAARLISALSDQAGEQAALWPRVLSHRYWQLEPTLVWQLSWQVAKDHLSWEEVLLANQQTKPIAEFFITLANQALDISFDRMLAYLSGSLALELNPARHQSFISPFASHYLLSSGDDARQWRLSGHLSILIKKMKEAYPEQPADLKLFLGWCEGYIKAGLKILDTNPFQEARQAVQLMTAYASKGREFSHVFLLYICDQQWGSSARTQNGMISLPQNLRQIKVENSGDDEKLRLLFVAASRAKSDLYLVGYDREVSGKSVSSLRYLAEQLTEDKLISPLLGSACEAAERPIAPKINPAASAAFWYDPHFDPFIPEREALLSERLVNFSLSATRLNNYLDVAYGGPRQFYLHELLRFPSPPSLAGVFGSCIHLTLDWHFQTSKQQGSEPSVDQALKFFYERLASYQLPIEQKEQLNRRGERALSAFLGSKQLPMHALDSSEEKLEVSFDGLRLSGAIDRMLIDEPSKTIQIIDFKTGKSYDRFGGNVKSHHHLRQLYVYKILLNHHPKYAKYSVNSASVYFIEPDQDSGQLKHIDLAFNDQEYELTRKLLVAVWQAIMQLSFPATDNYPATLAGIKQFEKWLLDQPSSDQLLDEQSPALSGE